jgi:diguanylate cyclase (GGDEF)-like protein/PAS domain S-box-containing protein
MTEKRQPSVLRVDEEATQTIELTSLFTENLTTTGSFDVRSNIWKTTFGKLIQALPIPTLLIDRSYRITIANQAWKKVSPDYDKIQGKLFSLIFPNSESAKQAQAILEEVFSTRKPRVVEANLKIQKSRIRGRMTFRSIRIAEDRLVLVLFEDLTAEHRLLKETKTYRKELEKRVEERTAELSAANKMLSHRIREQKEAEEALLRSREQLRLLTDSLPAAVAHLDNQHRYLFANNTYEKWMNVSRESILGLHVSEVLGKEFYDRIKDNITEALSGREVTFEVQVPFGDGQIRDVISTYVPELSQSGEVSGLIALITDISDLKRAERETVRAKEEWERTFDTVPDLIMILDSGMRVVRMNKAMADALGIRPHDAVGTLCHELCHGTNEPPKYCPLCEVVANERENSAEIVESRLGGVFLVSVTPTYDSDGQLAGFVHVARDITEQKRLEEDLRRMATTDSLTGLFNRRHFWDLSERELARAKRGSHTISLLMIDLDHFKSVNDTYGHEVGDKVLKHVAKVGLGNLREVDIMGRIGGEEFAVLLQETSLPDALTVAERLRTTVARESITTDHGPVTITISIGVAELSGETLDLETLFKHADNALYTAKKNGRNRVESIAQVPESTKSHG